mmetsp:Transcript_26909/g.50235  ORF Transcript_26909/g.50235 Transcript_26909/m.50235 type:complete len:168 (+) Transcript_26909:1180-1683(+)
MAAVVVAVVAVAVVAGVVVAGAVATVAVGVASIQAVDRHIITHTLRTGAALDIAMVLVGGGAIKVVGINRIRVTVTVAEEEARAREVAVGMEDTVGGGVATVGMDTDPGVGVDMDLAVEVAAGEVLIRLGIINHDTIETPPCGLHPPSDVQRGRPARWDESCCSRAY